MHSKHVDAGPFDRGEMVGRIRVFDWSATPLGSIERWSPALHAIVDMLLAHGFPMVLLWGPELIQIYNDGYRQILGDRHPGGLGQPTFACWPETFDVAGPLVARARAGETVTLENARFPVARTGEVETAWFTVTFSPVLLGEAPGSVLVTPLDTTARVLADEARDAALASLREGEKRQAFLLRLSDALRSLSDPIAIQETAMRVLGASLGVNRAFYGDAADDGDTLVIGPGYSRDTFPLEGPVRFSDFELDMAAWYRSGRTYVIEDTQRDMRFGETTKAGFRAIAVGAAVGVPLVKDGCVRAIVSLHQSVPRRWTAMEVSLLEDTAERTWAAVERARAEARLRESEARFRAFVTASSDVIYRMSPDWSELRQLDGRAFLANTVAPRSGWMTQYIAPDDQPEVERAIREAIRTRSVFELEHRVRRADGTPGWTLSRAVPILDDTGGVVEWLGTASDVTGRKEAEQALRGSEERYQALFAASPVPFMVLAPNPPDFTIIAANDAYFAATLTTRGGLIGRRLFDVFTDDRTRPGQLGSEALDLSLARVLASRRTDAMERVRYDLVVPGGFEPHWWEATNAPMMDATGRIVAIIHQVDRVTDLHLAEMAEQDRQTRQAFLLKIGDALRALADSAEMERVATRVLGEELGVDRAFLATIDADGESWTVRHDYTRGIPSHAGRHSMSDFQRKRLPQWQTGRMSSVADSEADPTFDDADRAAYAAFGTRAAVGVPLVKGGRFAALLSVNQIGARAWTGAELELIREVAERIWAAIERARAEEALRESEARFAQFAASSSDALWIRDAHSLEMEYVSPAIEPIYGVSPGTLLDGTQNWTALIVPEDRAAALSHLEQARGGKATVHEFRIQRPSDGATRWIRDTDFPLYDSWGRVQRIGGIAQDVTEARLAAERQGVLVAELQHRTRNLIAVVRGIANDTMRETRPTEAFRAAFADRLSALSRVQGLLSRSEAEPITIGSLLRLELDALGAGAADDRVAVEGPEVFLRPSSVQTLALALHELATNARKHGALSHEDGRLAVTWRKRSEAGERRLTIVWVETGLEQAPERPASESGGGGYGRELIEQALPHALGARTSYALSASGVRCTIDLAVRPGRSES